MFPESSPHQEGHHHVLYYEPSSEQSSKVASWTALQQSIPMSVGLDNIQYQPDFHLREVDVANSLATKSTVSCAGAQRQVQWAQTWGLEMTQLEGATASSVRGFAGLPKEEGGEMRPKNLSSQPLNPTTPRVAVNE